MEYNFFLYIAMFFIHIINIKSDLYMKRLFFILWCICSVVCFFISCTRKPDKATLTIYCTTDVHGSLFDFDLKQNRPTLYSLAGVAGYLSEERKAGDREYILLDGGDILQGQPSNYYFN